MTARDAPVPTSWLACRWLDEALATAVANGWMYAQRTGRVDTTAWYDDPVSDRFAHAIYPRVAEYLDRSRPLDDELLAYISAQFAHVFPQALREPQVIMPYFTLITDAPDDSVPAFTRPIRRLSQARGTMISNRFDADSIGEALADPSLTILRLTADRVPPRALLRRLLPSDAVRPGVPLVYTLIDRRHPVLIIQATSPAKVKAALRGGTTTGFPTPVTGRTPYAW